MTYRFVTSIDAFRPKDFDINRLTLSDVNVLAVLFYTVPVLMSTGRVVNAARSPYYTEDPTAARREYQIETIDALCQTAGTKRRHHMRGPYYPNELALAFVLFCYTYCPNELRRYTGQWRYVWALTHSGASVRRKREAYRGFIQELADHWLEIYRRLGTDPDTLAFERRCHIAWPTSRRWSRHVIDAYLWTDICTSVLANLTTLILWVGTGLDRASNTWTGLGPDLEICPVWFQLAVEWVEPPYDDYNPWSAPDLDVFSEFMDNGMFSDGGPSDDEFYSDDRETW